VSVVSRQDTVGQCSGLAIAWLFGLLIDRSPAMVSLQRN
jgi:hypothetical protein